MTGKTRGKKYHAPRWLWENTKVKELLDARQTGKVSERTTGGVAERCGISRYTLNNQIHRMRGVAQGHPDSIGGDTVRHSARVFMGMWEQLGPTADELNALRDEGRRKRFEITPAKAASTACLLYTSPSPRD